MGRLFDAVAAVLGFHGDATYEGQAAIELEQLAGDEPADPWPWRFGASTELVTQCYLEAVEGRDPAWIAASFHETVAASAAARCAETAASETVILSGGSFQNMRLLRSTRERLEGLGFRVLTHRLVPPNDGGISYGQAAVAAQRTA
jgi:hydrogenase maturation protein HypF